jgi:hypothetical protein
VAGHTMKQALNGPKNNLKKAVLSSGTVKFQII